MITKYYFFLLMGVLFLSSCNNSEENIVTAPDVPVNVKGEWVDKQIKLSWESPKYTDELEYEIFLKEGNEFKLIIKTTATSYTMSQHSLGGNVFKVRSRSLNNSTLCSNFTDEIAVIVEYEKNKKDIQALYAIMQTNTNSGLQWEFDFDAGNSENPIDIRNYSKTVVFSNIDREQRVTSLNLSYTNQSYSNFSDISDISKLEELRSLACSDNQLTSLDVSKNTKLSELYCENNELTSLDVSDNKELTRIFCYNNELTSLKMSKSIMLTALLCSNNQLASLDVKDNTTLEILSCDNNRLASLDISKNAALTALLCNHNQLTTLDVSNNTKLTKLSCINNLFQEGSVWILKSFIDEAQSIEQNQKGYLLPAKNSTIYKIINSRPLITEQRTVTQ